MTLRYGLKEATIKKMYDVFAYFPQIEKVIIYGSRAKGNYKNGSDIDLTLQGDKDLTFDVLLKVMNDDVLLKVMNDLDELLLPYTIDLSIFNDITDGEVIEHIQHAGMVFYEKGKKSLPA